MVSVLRPGQSWILLEVCLENSLHIGMLPYTRAEPNGICFNCDTLVVVVGDGAYEKWMYTATNTMQAYKFKASECK